MKFAIGYQQPEHEPLPAMVADYRHHVEEVYFPWVAAPSGRAPLGAGKGGRDWQAQTMLEEDLAHLREMGIRLDLLFNANCYGGDALSERLADEVCSIVDHLGDICNGPDIITTTSLTIAHVIKSRFPAIETRASVNMRIGTTRAMDYVRHLFDGFYLQRDLQRDPEYVRKVHDWCRAHGKKLCLLANSGCLRFCPGQVFHDNAVAHDAEISARRNLTDWNPHVCWTLYHDPARLTAFLQSTWIRPEDLPYYEDLADLVKLATRQHTHPRMVLEAYTSGTFHGNLMNLMEPCFAPALAPRYIANEAFPADWFSHTSRCNGDCDTCDYCSRVLHDVLKTYDRKPPP